MQKTSSTVDLREMTRLHDTMVKKLESSPEVSPTRHIDMTDTLANLEKTTEDFKDTEELELSQEQTTKV